MPETDTNADTRIYQVLDMAIELGEFAHPAGGAWPDHNQVLDMAIELGDLARRLRRRDANEQGLISGDIVVSGPLVVFDGEGENEQASQATTASDLLDLPHVVIWRDGDHAIVTEFVAGWPAHEFAMRKMNETPNKPVDVCVIIRTLALLPAHEKQYKDWDLWGLKSDGDYEGLAFAGGLP